MTRPHRLDFEGAWHHVMNRGANHQPIFGDDEDRSILLSLIARAASRFGLEFHAYCFMQNHFHLLVRSPAGQLSMTLQFIQQTYTQKFNARHERDGALFRGRFHSILVDSETYLDVASRYIHRNPMTKSAANVHVLDSHEWSSLPAYEGRHSSPAWLLQHEVLNRFSSRAAYSAFVRDNHTDTPTARFYRTPFEQHGVLGDSDFAERSRKRAGDEERLTAGILSVDVCDIDSEVLRLSKGAPGNLARGGHGVSNIVRSVAVQVAFDYTRTPLDELANRYGFASPHSAGAAVRRARRSESPDLLRLRAAALHALNLAALSSSKVPVRRV
jgi:putative transposase